MEVGDFWKRARDALIDAVDPTRHRNEADMVYAYRKCMPMVLMEMGMRQNTDSWGGFARLPDRGDGRDRYGAYLALTWARAGVALPEGSEATLYNAWGDAVAVFAGPGHYVLYAGRDQGTGDVPNIIRSTTPFNRLVVSAPTGSDEPSLDVMVGINDAFDMMVVRPSMPSKDQVPDEDPREMPGSRFFDVAATLAVLNPTTDKRLLRGLQLTDGASANYLDGLKSLAGY